MRGVRLAGVVLVVAAMACSDALEQATPVGQEIVILDGQASSLTLVNRGDFSEASLALAFPVAGVPQIAGRGSTVLIARGVHDSLQILTLGGPAQVAAVSNQVGAAFQDDRLGWEADSAFDSRVQLTVR